MAADRDKRIANTAYAIRKNMVAFLMHDIDKYNFSEETKDRLLKIVARLNDEQTVEKERCLNVDLNSILAEIDANFGEYKTP